MAFVRSKLRTFGGGGVHPHDFKSLTSEESIRNAPIPPEAVIPLSEFGRMGDTNIMISLAVEGSVDKRTAEYTAKVIEDRLKNVLVKARSSGGASDHKRIRFLSKVG